MGLIKCSILVGLAGSLFSCCANPEQRSEQRVSKVDTALTELIKNIDKNPDALHPTVTPATRTLVLMGKPGAEAVVFLLLSEKRQTRVHARAVIAIVTGEMFGFRHGYGWDTVEHKKEWEKFWDSLQNLNIDLSPEARLIYADRCAQWLHRFSSSK